MKIEIKNIYTGEHENIKEATKYCAQEKISLRGADLLGANLRGANIDMIGFPLSCGGLKWKIDRKLFAQFAYHLCSHNVDDEECKAVQESLKKLANEMHRTDVPRL
jgi:hypothetical protein